jgi:hypothetical protein
MANGLAAVALGRLIVVIVLLDPVVLRVKAPPFPGRRGLALVQGLAFRRRSGPWTGRRAGLG